MTGSRTLTVSRADTRSPVVITLTVWRALILREAVARLFATRTSWAWVYAEPLLHVLYLTVIYTTFRVHKVGDLDTVTWLVAGLISYFMFRKTGDRCAKGVDDNSALFAYRQVKPVDTLIARAILEFSNLTVTVVLIIAVLSLSLHPFIIEDPLELLLALGGMWVLGLSYGLVVSALVALAPEARLLLQVVMRPMYLVSGVVFPIGHLPPAWRETLMYNPAAQGIELARQAISSGYRAVPETDAAYFGQFLLCILLIGLFLHRRFGSKIISQ